MKKFLLISLVLLTAFSFSACGKKEPVLTNTEPPVDLGAPETGLVLDATNLNNQTVTTTPGDIVYIKLVGEALGGKQWTVASPTSGDYLMLKDHKLVGLGDKAAPEGKFTDEWWLKVENTGSFRIQFDYGRSGKRAEKSFKIQVVSQ